MFYSIHVSNPFGNEEVCFYSSYLLIITRIKFDILKIQLISFKKITSNALHVATTYLSCMNVNVTFLCHFGMSKSMFVDIMFLVMHAMIHCDIQFVFYFPIWLKVMFGKMSFCSNHMIKYVNKPIS
jgi:hypothetical protein